MSADQSARVVIAAPMRRAAAAISRAAEGEIRADDAKIVGAAVVGIGHAIAIYVGQQRAALRQGGSGLPRTEINWIGSTVAVEVISGGVGTAVPAIHRQTGDGRAGITIVGNGIAVGIGARIGDARQQPGAQFGDGIAAKLRHAAVGGDVRGDGLVSNRRLQDIDFNGIGQGQTGQQVATKGAGPGLGQQRRGPGAGVAERGEGAFSSGQNMRGRLDRNLCGAGARHGDCDQEQQAENANHDVSRGNDVEPPL